MKKSPHVNIEALFSKCGHMPFNKGKVVLMAVQCLNVCHSNFNLSMPNNKFKLVCLPTSNNQLYNFPLAMTFVFNVVSYKCLILLEKNIDENTQT